MDKGEHLIAAVLLDVGGKRGRFVAIDVVRIAIAVRGTSAASGAHKALPLCAVSVVRHPLVGVAVLPTKGRLGVPLLNLGGGRTITVVWRDVAFEASVAQQAVAAVHAVALHRRGKRALPTPTGAPRRLRHFVQLAQIGRGMIDAMVAEIGVRAILRTDTTGAAAVRRACDNTAGRAHDVRLPGLRQGRKRMAARQQKRIGGGHRGALDSPVAHRRVFRRGDDLNGDLGVRIVLRFRPTLVPLRRIGAKVGDAGEEILGLDLRPADADDHARGRDGEVSGDAATDAFPRVSGIEVGKIETAPLFGWKEAMLPRWDVNRTWRHRQRSFQ
mmetsp:Transcript_255/g.997  ORF Transcript_255/g.997 Transcript_255/m.997 type:complete len:328 (+) Transcript_255:846-1829(+)